MSIHTFPASTMPAEIGCSLRRLRRDRRWSQETLSSLSGVPRETISRCESAVRPVMADTVLRLAAVLLAGQEDVELQDLVPSWPEADVVAVDGHGPRSRARRRTLTATLSKVADAAGVSPATLSRFERNAGPTPSLLRYRTTALGEIEASVCSDPLARALGFRDHREHDAFCQSEDWATWPVRHGVSSFATAERTEATIDRDFRQRLR